MPTIQLQEIEKILLLRRGVLAMKRKTWREFIVMCVSGCIAPAFRDQVDLPEVADRLRTFFREDPHSIQTLRELVGDKIKDADTAKLLALHQCLILASMFDMVCELLPWRRLGEDGWQLPQSEVDRLAKKVCARFHADVESRNTNIDEITASEHNETVEALIRITPATFRDFADRLTLGVQVENVKEMEAIFPIYLPGKDTTGHLFLCLASPRFRHDGEVFIELNNLLQRMHGSELLNIMPTVTGLLRAMTKDLQSKLPDVRIRFRPMEIAREQEEEAQDVLILDGPSAGGAILAAALRAACRIPLRRRLIYTMALPANKSVDDKCQPIGGIDKKLLAIVREYAKGRGVEGSPRLVVAPKQGGRAFENACDRWGIELVYIATPQDFLMEARLRQEFFLPQNPAPVPAYFRERPSELKSLLHALRDTESRTLILLHGERSAGKTRLWSRCWTEISSGSLLEQYRGGILLDFLTDRNIASLFVTQFNDLLERDGRASLYSEPEAETPTEIEQRIDRILKLLADTGGHYLLVLENLEMALRETPLPHAPVDEDLKLLLRKIASYPTNSIKIVALSACLPDLQLEWDQDRVEIDMGRGDLPIQEDGIPFLREVGVGCPALSSATDAQLEALLTRIKTSVPFDLLLLVDAFRTDPDLSIDTYPWSGRKTAIHRSWNSLDPMEQVALQMIDAVSPLLPTEAEIITGTRSILASSLAFDLSRLVQLGFLGLRLPGPEDQGAVSNDTTSPIVSLLAEVASYLRQQDPEDLPHSREIFQWGANYCSQILSSYNDLRSNDISAMAFLNFENDHFLTAAASWLHCIARTDDKETARLQWLTFVFKTVIWWDEYLPFAATYQLLQLWTKTPFYQSEDGKITFRLMERFLEDYPRGSEWRTRDQATVQWLSIAHTLKSLRMHMRMDGRYPPKSKTDQHQLRTMIDDYYAEALWHGGLEGAEEIYLTSIEAYWGSKEMKWVAPFNHPELAELYLSRGYVALAFRQCQIAFERGEVVDEWSKKPVAPDEPETLFWIYRVLSDSFWQFYRHTGEKTYIEASVVASQLSVWYAFVFQAVPQPADNYTVNLAEEAYLRSLLRLREAACGDRNMFSTLSTHMQRLWWQSETSIDLGALPAEPWSASEQDLRHALFPAQPYLSEVRRLAYADNVKKVASDKNMGKQILEWKAFAAAMLEKGIQDSTLLPIFHRIRSREDRYVGNFLDMLQQYFPLNEQVPFSAVWDNMRDSNNKVESRLEVILKAVPDPKERVCEGILWTEIDRKHATAFVWYFAIRDKNRGFGSQVWQAMTQRLRMQGIKAIVWEVERPDHAEDPDMARRRIRFYRRQGAQLTDAEYVQDVGWRPPTPMYLMIQPLIPMSAERQRKILKAVAGATLASVEDIDIEDIG